MGGEIFGAERADFRFVCVSFLRRWRWAREAWETTALEVLAVLDGIRNYGVLTQDFAEQGRQGGASLEC